MSDAEKKALMVNFQPQVFRDKCSALSALESYLWYMNQQWTMGLGFYATK